MPTSFKKDRNPFKKIDRNAGILDSLFFRTEEFKTSSLMQNLQRSTLQGGQKPDFRYNRQIERQLKLVENLKKELRNECKFGETLKIYIYNTIFALLKSIQYTKIKASIP